jgi:hypothetical protein
MKWQDVEDEAYEWVKKNIGSYITLKYDVTCGAMTVWVGVSDNLVSSLRQHLEGYVTTHGMLELV